MLCLARARVRGVARARDGVAFAGSEKEPAAPAERSSLQFSHEERRQAVGGARRCRTSCDFCAWPHQRCAQSSYFGRRLAGLALREQTSSRAVRAARLKGGGEHPGSGTGDWATKVK